MDRAVETATAKRRFFVTKKGYMGLGPQETQHGDRVFVLFGGSVPFVLRNAGRRHIPGLGVRQDELASVGDDTIFCKKGREAACYGSTKTEAWLDSTSATAPITNCSMSGGPSTTECVLDDGDCARSLALPPDSLAIEVGQLKPGLSVQSHNAHCETFTRPLSQCYELIGDCFVHGIMDGEATVLEKDGVQEVVEPGVVYLI